MIIYVDADAFPKALLEIVVRAGGRAGVPVVLVANRPGKTPAAAHVSRITAPPTHDGVDDLIVELLAKGDLVVTADIPFADRVVSKGGFALDPRGDLYSEVNVKQRLASRHLMDELRVAGVVSGGPASFGTRDVQAFTNQLDRFLAKDAKARRADAARP